MRILLSILIAVCLLGGTLAYTRFANRIRAAAVVIEPNYAAGEYSIEIDRTFDCVPDDLFDAPGLVVRFLGEEIYRSEGTVAAAEPIRITTLPNVEVAQNEINVTASLAPDARGLAAMRVRVFRDNALIKEANIADTAELGSIGGAVTFNVDAPAGGSDHDGGTDSNEGTH